MRLLSRALIWLAVAVAASLAPALADDPAGTLTVEHPVARPNLPGRPAAAYMTIVNAGDADTLIGARSPAFEAVELHESVEVDGVVQMRPVAELRAGAGQTVRLEPGGLHLMLLGGEAHKAGDTFPLTLVFENAGEVEVDVEVERLPAMHGH